RARTAIAAAKIASFDVMAAAGVPAVGALDLRHPDLEVAIPARAALLARGGVFGVAAPGADRLLALPVRHGDAEPVSAARRFHAEEAGLFARELHHAVRRGGVAVVAVVAAQRAEHHRVVRRRGEIGEWRGHGDGLRKLAWRWWLADVSRERAGIRRLPPGAAGPRRTRATWPSPRPTRSPRARARYRRPPNRPPRPRTAPHPR